MRTLIPLTFEPFHRAIVLAPDEVRRLPPSVLKRRPLRGFVLGITATSVVVEEIISRESEIALEVAVEYSSRATLLLLSLRFRSGTVHTVIPLADELTLSWVRWCIERKAVRWLVRTGERVASFESSLARNRTKLQRVLADATSYSDRTDAAMALVNSRWLCNAETVEDESSQRWHWVVEGLEADVSAAQSAAIATWRAFETSR